MKKMSIVRSVMLAAIICSIAPFAFAADPAATTAAAPAAAAADPSLFAWFVANKAAIFGVALAISEFLTLIPGFKGNGILDTIIQALKVLSAKETPAGSQ